MRRNRVERDHLMSIIEERRHIVHTAAFWFNAAHKAREEGKHTEAFFNMVNAYNHVENALAAVRNSIKSLPLQENTHD
jgi:hypothetical protein